MKKDKEWLKDKIKDEEDDLKYVYDNYVPYEKVLISDDVHYLIDQLDEPEKPVIPQFVADYIEQSKKDNDSINQVFAFMDDKEDKDLWHWLFPSMYEEKRANQEVFMRAWLDGFTIASEDKQEVEENFYTFDNAKKWLHDNGFVVFEKDKLDEEVQRMVDETYEATNEKPVIPQFVADWIESYRKKTLVELINDAVYSSDEDSKCFRRWFHEEMGFESNYSEFLARAWLDGFTVEKEKKYRVVFRSHKDDLILFQTGEHIFIGAESANGGYWKQHFTESEIKAIDERYLAFTEPA